MKSFVQLFLPTYYIVFLILAVFWRIIFVKRKTGINAFSLLNATGHQGVIGAYFKMAPFGSTLVIIIYTFFNELYPYLASFNWIQSNITTVIGIVLLVLSLIWIIVAQIQMGISWRIGIDSLHKTKLKKAGLFSLSRNPIFLGIKINVLGFFLILPNAITLTILILDIALIDVQVALEEEHLLKIHGEDYKEYANRVRRWF